MPAYVSALVYWVAREAWRVLPADHAARVEWQDLHRRLDPADFARSEAEARQIRFEPGIPLRAAEEMRLMYARRWARLYHAHTGGDIADHPDAEQPLLDARGGLVHQFILAL